MPSLYQPKLQRQPLSFHIGIPKLIQEHGSRSSLLSLFLSICMQISLFASHSFIQPIPLAVQYDTMVRLNSGSPLWKWQPCVNTWALSLSTVCALTVRLSWQIVGLIILGIVLDLGGGPTHDRIGFRYWKQPGSFNQLNGIPGAKGCFLAFWATFINAAFSFLGTEIVALAAAEVENPRRNMPKAIRRVFYRILLFYIGGVIVIGWLVPYNDSRLLGASTAASSPFVIAIENAKIRMLPSIINSVILSSAFSAGNSVLYASSRTLYGLACIGQAPSFLRKCTSRGLPVWCVFITCKIRLIFNSQLLIFSNKRLLDSSHTRTLTKTDLPSSDGLSISRLSQVLSLGTSSWSHMCGSIKGSHTTASIEIPCPTRHPSNLTQATLASFLSVLSFF